MNSASLSRLAGAPLSLRRNVGREGSELRRVLGACGAGRALPVRTPSQAAKSARITLPEYTDEIWHGYLPDVGPGQLYGYRCYGPHDPARGHRFNHYKLLLDPYARAIVGKLNWRDAHFGYRIGAAAGDLSFSRRDSARWMPKCQVMDPSFDWGDDAPPRHQRHDTIIYEAHVRGLTMRHPGVPEALRGTFAGLAYPAVVDYLRWLGVTAIELLPVQAFVQDRHLIDRGARQLLGLQYLSLLRPRATLPRERPRQRIQGVR